VASIGARIFKNNFTDMGFKASLNVPCPVIQEGR